MTSKRIWIPLALLAVVGAGVSTDSPAQAAAPHHDRVLHIGVAQAFVCHGVLETITDLESLQGTHWQFMPDDGWEDIQVRLRDGRWISVGSTSGGEGHRRWAGYLHAGHLATLVRMIRSDGTRITSTPHPISECPYSLR